MGVVRQSSSDSIFVAVIVPCASTGPLASMFAFGAISVSPVVVPFVTTRLVPTVNEKFGEVPVSPVMRPSTEAFGTC